MRLIDADALKKMMFNYYECVNEHTNKIAYTGETLMDYEVADLIEDCFDNAPTIDAVEVVHGRWEKRKTIIFDDEMVGYRCSKCNTTWDAETNYCPNCGAKMDGEENEID